MKNNLNVNLKISQKNNYIFEPIAYLKSNLIDPIDAPQQGVFAKNANAEIDLKKFKQWKEMIYQLEKFSHIWIIFVFHKNNSWKPLVLPPRSENKVGVFASRSPYRPNPIGISTVRLIEVSESKLIINSHDLLDGTPILDIKPYIAYADSFTNASKGWLADCKEYKLKWSAKVLKQLKFLDQWDSTQFKSIITQQLKFNPTDKKRKRVKKVDPKIETYVLSIRTWRIYFQIVKSKQLKNIKNLNNTIQVLEIKSGYNNIDITTEDKYQDLEIHHAFNSIYN